MNFHGKKFLDRFLNEAKKILVLSIRCNQFSSSIVAHKKLSNSNNNKLIGIHSMY
jgi:hypothetical protein